MLSSRFLPHLLTLREVAPSEPTRKGVGGQELALFLAPQGLSNSVPASPSLPHVEACTARQTASVYGALPGLGHSH